MTQFWTACIRGLTTGFILYRVYRTSSHSVFIALLLSAIAIEFLIHQVADLKKQI